MTKGLEGSNFIKEITTILTNIIGKTSLGRLNLTYTCKYYGTLRLVKEGSHNNRISIQGACLIPLRLHKGIIQGTSATIKQTNQSVLQSQT